MTTHASDMSGQSDSTAVSSRTTYREGDRAACKVFLEVLCMRAATHKAQPSVGRQAGQEVFQHFQVLLCMQHT